MENNVLGFFDFVKIDKYIWFAALNCNGLYRVDLRTMCTEYMGAFPEEPMRGKYLYRSIVRYEDRLIFAPFMAESIGEYDLKNNKFIKHEKLEYADVKFKFESAVLVGETVFFIPQNYDYIVSYDIKYAATTNVLSINEVFADEIYDDKEVALGIGAVTLENCTYVPKRCSEMMIKYDFEQNTYELIKEDDKSCLLINVLIDDWLWMLPGRRMPIMKWNIKTNERRVYSDFVRENGEEGAPFIKAIDCGEKILFWRETASKSLVYDKKTDTFEELSVSYEPTEELLENPWAGNFYFAKKLDEHRILSVSKKDHAVVIFDIANAKIDSYKLRMSNNDNRLWNREVLRRRLDTEERREVYHEDRLHSLEWFFELVKKY